jgi:hypothetical protein
VVPGEQEGNGPGSGRPAPNIVKKLCLGKYVIVRWRERDNPDEEAFE